MADSPIVQKSNDVTPSESAMDVAAESDDVPSKAHLLLEEATSLATAPPHVQDLVNSLGAYPDPADVTATLILVVLVQTGFRLTQNDACSSTRTFDARVLRRLRSLPPGFIQTGRAERYKLPLWLSGHPDTECRLVGFLSEDTLLFTLVILPDTSFSLAIQPSVHGCLDNVSSLCEKTYKLALAARAHLLEDSTEVVPTLTGLPYELILAIFFQLSFSDLCRVSCVCRLLNTVAKDNALWRRFLHFKYPGTKDPTDGEFKKKFACKYAEEVQKARLEQRRRPFGGAYLSLHFE